MTKVLKALARESVIREGLGVRLGRLRGEDNGEGGA